MWRCDAAAWKRWHLRVCGLLATVPFTTRSRESDTTAVERISICQTSAPVSSVSFDVWRFMAKPLSSSAEYSLAEIYSISLIFTVEHHLHITSASFLIKFEALPYKFAISSVHLLPALPKHEGTDCFLSVLRPSGLWSQSARFSSHSWWWCWWWRQWRWWWSWKEEVEETDALRIFYSLMIQFKTMW